MAFALQHLSSIEREQIARALYAVDSSKSSGAELRGLCPFHEEKNPSFSYNVDRDAYNCLGCGVGGDLVTLWAHGRGISDPSEALREFKREFNISTGQSPAPRTDRPATGPSMNVPPPAKADDGPFIDESVYASLAPLPPDWLSRLTIQRGWSPETIERMGLRYHASSENDRRIAIPIRDDAGRLLNIRRYLPGGEPKVFSWYRFVGKKKETFGTKRLYPAPAQWAEGDLWLCEGEPDVLCALSHGINAVTQTCGAQTWAEKFNRHFRGRDVIVAYDADLPGQKGAEKAANALAKVARSVRLIVWPDFMRGEGGAMPSEHGQDVTDWYVRHGKSSDDLRALLADAVEWKAPEPEKIAPDPAIKKGPLRFFQENAKGRMVFVPALLADGILEEYSFVVDTETELVYRWTGKSWAHISAKWIEAIALRMMEGMVKTSAARDAANIVFHRSLIPVDRRMNDNANLHCTQNGMLNIDTRELLAHDPDYYTSQMLPFEFKATAKCPTWLKVLDMNIGRPDVIRQLRQFFGYCLTRDTRHRTALILKGPPASGKSKILEVLTALVGEDNCSAVQISALDKPFERATLKDKLLNVSTEEDAHHFGTAMFQAVVAGDRVNASFKNRDFFEFYPYAKHAYATNVYPAVSGDNEAFIDRLILIEFERQFQRGERDTYLKEKLLDEMSGIFVWALDGLVDLRTLGGFSESETTTRALRRFKMHTSSVQSFVEDRCEILDRDVVGELLFNSTKISVEELYEAYKAYCRAAGSTPRARNNFGVVLAQNYKLKRSKMPAPIDDMREETIEEERKRLNCYIGVKLIPAPLAEGSNQ